MNIGILSAGGDCPGLNAVIRAVVLTVKNRDINNKVFGFLDGFSGLYTSGAYMTLDKRDVENIERTGGTILGTSNKGDFGEVGLLKAPSPQALATIEKIKQTKEELQLDGLIVTGGDGSLRIAYWIGQQTGINIIGIPKTIDNDLSNTEVTLGFNTAITTATEAIGKIHDSARSHHRAMIIELMGRDAGWIALESGIAGGADCILLPEIPYNFEHLEKYLDEKADSEYKAIIIIVAEGAHPMGEPSQHPNTGAILTKKIQENTKLESRLSVLGYIQRGGEPTTFDKILGTRLGEKAASLLLDGENSQFVSVKNDTLIPLPLSMASSETRFVPRDHDLIKAAKSIGIYFGE
ncbi:MAG: ATP-dependent 6-phosphofructokinase [bacterium]|nr:ATP-dependent 6-phosphofructokinase [bacterium]